MRVQNVLVPVDFSPPSRLAVNYGITLARKFRAKLTLLHVMEFPAALGPGFPAGDLKVEAEHRHQVTRMLSALVGSEDQDDLDLGIVVKSGAIEDGIYATIAEQLPDLIIMGTHGRSLLGRWLIGSVTQSVLRKVTVPVLTVCRIARPMIFKRILFSTDLSESSRRAFSFALKLARAMESEIVVFHALERVNLATAPVEMVPYIGETDREKVQQQLAEFVAEEARNEVKVETVLVEGVAAKELLKAVEENDIDLILMAIHDKGIIERAFVGSTAEQVVRDAHVPVLCVSDVFVQRQLDSSMENDLRSRAI